MPAATTKADLLAVTRKEWERLAALVAEIPDWVALAKDAEDTSIKDIVGHRAHWIELYFGWWEDGEAGRPVALPAPGYKWNELKRYNADLRAAQAHLGWDETRALLAGKHGALMAFLKARSEDELYGAPMKGGNNAWPTGRWAEAAGASHYRSAAKYIRARLKEAGNGGA